jgi:hypothetical protein
MNNPFYSAEDVQGSLVWRLPWRWSCCNWDAILLVISPEFDLYKLDHCGDLPHLETLAALNRMIWPAQLVIQHLSGVSPTKSEEGKANHRWRSPKRHGFVRKWGMRYSCNTATRPCCIENMINHSSRFEGTLFLDKPGLLLHWSPDNLEPRIALTISSGIVRLWIDSVFTQHGEKLKEWRTVASFMAIWWFDVCGAYFMLGQWQDMSSWPSWPLLAASCPFLAASHEDEYAREKKGDGGHRAKGRAWGFAVKIKGSFKSQDVTSSERLCSVVRSLGSRDWN